MLDNLISIVIAAYNADKYIEASIESCLKQTHHEIEIIIVNDGSTDNTALIIDKYAQTTPLIKVIHQENKGVGFARNVGNHFATSELIAVLDADDLMTPTRLEEQYAFMKANEDIDGISCWASYINDQGKQIGYCISPTDLKTREDYQHYIAIDKPFIGLIHSGMLYRKSAVLGVGGYRNIRPGQDSDLWNRMAENGSKLLVLPKVLLKYRIYQSKENTSAGIKTLYASNWLQESMRRRKHGITEITFEQYMADIHNKPLFERINVERKIYAKYYFKHAALRLGHKSYFGFIASFFMAALLDFSMVLKRVKKQLNFKKEGQA
jgi:glycosyltransferase involved in cell wall biosynthesis